MRDEYTIKNIIIIPYERSKIVQTNKNSSVSYFKNTKPLIDTIFINKLSNNQQCNIYH